MSSLQHKAINGVSWSLVDNISNKGITFLIGIILARLLTPAEFGVIGMITIFIAVSNSIIDSGFSNALIRKRNASETDYNTAFIINFLLGILLYMLLFLFAPLISNFFNEPILLPVTRVMGLLLIINSFAIIQRTILVKKIDFKTQTKISIIASIISGVVGIAMALSNLSVWSLVGQQISKQLVNSILLWMLNKWRPVFEFSKNSFNELFGYGSKILLSGIIDSIYKNIYYIIIGKFYSSYQLGQYTRADNFNVIFSSNLTSIVQKVSYPVLSSIQEDQVRLRNAYRRIIKSTMLVTFACMLGLAAVAKPLIVVLIGEKWLPSVSFLQIICFSGMLYPLHAINLNILQVKGRSDLFLKLEIVKKIIAIIPICLGIFYGIEIMLWGSVLASFIAFFLNSHFSADLIKYPTLLQIKDILPTFIISFLVAGIMWSLTKLNFSYWYILPLQCLIGLVVTLSIYELIKIPEYLEVKAAIISIINRKYN